MATKSKAKSKNKIAARSAAMPTPEMLAHKRGISDAHKKKLCNSPYTGKENSEYLTAIYISAYRDHAAELAGDV